MSDTPPPIWVLPEGTLAELLQRAHDGEQPVVLLAEMSQIATFIDGGADDER